MPGQTNFRPIKVRTLLKTATIFSDAFLAGLYLTMRKERGSLLSFLFHGLFQSNEESQSGVIDPQQGITVDMFSAFIRYFREHSYRFVSPDDISAGLSPIGRYVLITFDDGYYNNLRALPVLEQFDVPAVFFISTNHVQYGKAFWWDVVFREFKKRHRTDIEIQQAIINYKRFQTADVEADLRKQFGDSALRPVSDLDRACTTSELRDFASHRLVFLGNHTKDHAILTNYSLAEIREQIQGAQDAIWRTTGKIPRIIAYPDGNDSPMVLKAAAEAGLFCGMSARPGRNRLPQRFGTQETMSMKRFTLWGNYGIEQQCQASRSGLSLYRLFKGIDARVETRFSPSRLT